MTPAQKGLVQSTWSKVVPIADTAATLFYDRLFEIDPTTRPLFRGTDLAEQRRRLLQVLSVAIAGLDNLDGLVPAVEALGRRHAGYGVKDQHYDSVGAALLWTLERLVAGEVVNEVIVPDDVKVLALKALDQMLALPPVVKALTD